MFLVIRKADPVKKFGKLLRQLRETNSWTQEDLAAELSVDRAYVSQLERGIQNPSLLTMIKIADVFSVEVSFAGVTLG
jgi:transcriptional regulator with XRE-family HTH domain